MKVFTEENQDEFVQDEFVCHNIESNYSVCNKNVINCTFEYLIQYFIKKFFYDYKGNVVDINFYISKKKGNNHLIIPILLRITINYEENVGKVYKIQKNIEEDITDNITISVVDKEGNETQEKVSFFNAILVEDVEDEDDLVESKQKPEEQEQQQEKKQGEQVGGKVKAKGQKKKTSKKPVVSQSKENKYKEVLGKRMKIYKKPDSRKEFVRYKGELVALVEYKKSKKEMAKSKNAKK